MTTKYKLVPVEPTEGMILASMKCHNKWGEVTIGTLSKIIYKAMIEASPAQESEPVAYINVEKRNLEWARITKFETALCANYPKIPLYQHPPADKADAERIKKSRDDLLYELQNLVNSIDKDNPILLSRAFRHAQATIDKAMKG